MSAIIPLLFSSPPLVFLYVCRCMGRNEPKKALLNAGIARPASHLGGVVIFLQLQLPGLSLGFGLADYTRKIGSHKLKITSHGCCPLVVFKL